MTDHLTERTMILNRLHDRLDGFVLSAEPALVLDEAAVEDATRLLTMAQSEELDRQSLDDYEFQQVATELVAWLHWFRAALKSPEESMPDWEKTVRLFLTIAERNPQAIPRSLLQQIEATADQAPSGDDAGTSWSDRGHVAYQLWEKDGRADALDRAIAAFQRAVAEGLPGTPDHSLNLTLLCMVLRTRSEQNGDERDAQLAVDIGRRSVDDARESGAYVLQCLHHLALALAHRGALCGTLADLDEAVRLRREAIAESATLPGAEKLLPFLYDGLCTALLRRHWHRPNAEDLDEAIAAVRQAMVTAGEPDAGHLLDLCLVLTQRSQLTGDGNDLVEALQAGRAAVDAAVPGDERRPRALNNLSIALQLLASRSGSRGHLEYAVHCAELAVEASPADRFDGAGRMSQLANLLVGRFVKYGDSGDIDRAVELLRTAVKVTPLGHPRRPDFLQGLADALHQRFQRTHHLEDWMEWSAIRREVGDLD
ncbi:hypothetical protein DMA15_30255 [Streptomyces sp. WAC 01529]|uniref:hypothetical protein n=1 Tax=Streptomyces sp. WAC 01529 TaxID=2203205 RepID=UPI000F70CAAA|nr:hypothetical protein [Streptomyces sp. WAC 01529]AZM56346.1 hypothetical protein DMA15_30255 [Streptomyces sp. WAC 01529]